MQDTEIASNKFRKRDRVSSKRAIDSLFLEGKSGFVFPFKYLFTTTSPSQNGTHKDSWVQVLVSVPKRIHKRANKRNLLKRRTKEAYRLTSGELFIAAHSRNMEVKVALIYVAKGEENYKKIEHAVGKIIKEITQGI